MQTVTFKAHMDFCFLSKDRFVTNLRWKQYELCLLVYMENVILYICVLH